MIDSGAAIDFLSGILVTGYAVAALFFVRFWREARDRLFGFFAVAFTLLAIQRLLLVVIAPTDAAYLLRLVSFLLIIIAIVDKNRR
ncbi:MAG TPA: DUF5985 family protein [Thermoanaerobaculia bacterium]|nr:DUF5985 family protein [Thermoanaerobaculia bacterium]